MGLRKIRHNTRQNARYPRSQIGLARQVEQWSPWQSGRTAVTKQRVLKEKVLGDYSGRPSWRNRTSESQRITASGADECLTFAIIEKDNGVELKVIGWKALSPQPDEPDYIKGVIPLRGAEIPVLDLEILTGSGRSKMINETCIVLFENPEPYKHYFGIVVEGLPNVITIAHRYRHYDANIDRKGDFNRDKCAGKIAEIQEKETFLPC